MAGHSKWAKVKHFKGPIDAKRARIFAKLSRELAIAARVGGGDPGMNPRLRMVMLKCRAANMPADNIERAINRGTGAGDTAVYEDLTYEMFAPHGVALLVELSTDNRNRTAAEIRAILREHGGSMAAAGAVSRLFQKKGQIVIARDDAAENDLMEIALESGAEDFKSEPEGYEILVEPAGFEAVHKAIETRSIRCDSAAILPMPTLLAPLTAEQAAVVERLIDALEDHDDVKEVVANADFPH